MRRCEEDVAGFRIDERARRLADAGLHAGHVAGPQIHEVNLVERVARLAFALEDELATVLRPVTFTGSASLDGQPADPREEILFLVGLRADSGRTGGERRGNGNC